ncbi:MAG: 4-hydroxy-tetrahydrodipicolinate synthase [SAR116 cluster bacterium MED-G04]|nr:4-hydroxy-tetrahydrodipicolinate synthase [SAR116 cluster bacterium]PDH65769.1 MAG: 4-hydroxy-tetrahydrodipicolinate synthase [SAR116 cluster bacterium MED-G04]HCD49331.1 4-hydroxy-tetrahydrodipicolinate synthase [Alphaproteobacteria bacterium]HCV63269.1 4-hydroxy-tetrahydrodipicolinate synthase [Alphaproteobacteria bacterium]
MFGGSCVALITPFDGDGVDEHAFRKLVNWQITEGTNGLIPVGTTGESPTLSHEEHKRVVEICIEENAGRVPVIAGAGSNSTLEAVDFARHAASAGADALLVVTPYYNKPTQDGLKRHYTAIADAVSIPVIIYDIPGRSIIAMTNETMAELAAHPNITGVKDATADLARPTHLLNRIGPGFSQLSGEDGTALAYRAAGGHGCISVTANIAPRLLAEMHAAWDQGNIARAMEINAQLMPVHEAMFCEASPGPVKYAAGLLGLSSDSLRLPLCEIADTSKDQVRSALRHAGLLN